LAAIDEASSGEDFAGVDGNSIDLARDLIRAVCCSVLSYIVYLNNITDPFVFVSQGGF